jgi:acetoacetyl-CoA reductase/3-oxoacyl-[acyl-carrier protein] reductase
MSNNRRVLITGGTRGIGRGLVIAFARQGYQVAFTYRHQARLAAELEAELGTCVKGFALDQSDSAAIAPSVQAMAEATGGGFDILINNAAIAQEKPFMSITASDWSAMLNCNLQGPFLLAQACLPHMINQGWGRIINISSIGGQWGGFNQVHYAASKAGLISLTRSIAKIYSKNGIASIAIAIGLVETDMNAKELS